MKPTTKFFMIVMAKIKGKCHLHLLLADSYEDYCKIARESAIEITKSRGKPILSYSPVGYLLTKPNDEYVEIHKALAESIMNDDSDIPHYEKVVSAIWRFKDRYEEVKHV